MLTVVIADGNPVLRFGIRALLDPDPGIVVVGEAGDGAETLALARAHQPHVVLLDPQLPGQNGVATAAEIADTARVVMVASTVDPVTVLDAVAAGARGFLVHSQFGEWHLPDVVRGVANGLSYLCPAAAAALVDQCHRRGTGAGPECAPGLTPREHEVMELIAAGLSNREIAHRLVISAKTVKNHVHHIYKRLNADDREHSIALWRALSTSPDATESGGPST